MSINLDFSSIPKREPLPQGQYTLTVETAEQTTSQNGNEMIKIRFAVEGYPENKIFDNMVLTEKALWKMKEFMGALGYETEAIVSLELTDLVGQNVRAEIIQETYNDNPTNRVKKYLPS